MTPDAGAVRGAAGGAAPGEKRDLVGRPTSSDGLLGEKAGRGRAVQPRGDERARGRGTRGGRGPGAGPVSLLRRVLRAALDRVLDVVLQLRKALAGEGEPLPPDRLQHLAEQRVRRGGPRGAQ